MVTDNTEYQHFKLVSNELGICHCTPTVKRLYIPGAEYALQSWKPYATRKPT
jgi:hypothetical protein